MIWILCSIIISNVQFLLCKNMSKSDYLIKTNFVLINKRSEIMNLNKIHNFTEN